LLTTAWSTEKESLVPSIKLSVTARNNLERKYNPSNLKSIDRAVKEWISKDRDRGIKTIHVAVDDASAMKALGVPAVKTPITAAKVKAAVDALWERLAPDYLVLLGGDEIVPHFVVENPSYDPSGDDDKQVPTDNPYACSRPWNAKKLPSYLIPDRVVGRIPDMIDDGDPAWFVDYLATAGHWVSESADTFDKAYCICAHPWTGAGEKCTQYIGRSPSILLISPPEVDQSPKAKGLLPSRLHMIKCHGAALDARFFGQKGNSYPPCLSSGTLKSRLKPGTLAAAMCCYGAQVFSPSDPAAAMSGAWPIASTYLRGGSPGFVGSTMIAWVGVKEMVCADWIIAGYLKAVLGGASVGRAFLESKQEYVSWISQQGKSPDIADEKTLIEFVLLGDPSIQPVVNSKSEPVSKAPAATRRMAVAVLDQERRQRRVLRTQIAEQIRALLPSRTPAARAAVVRSGKIFKTVQADFDGDLKAFGIRPQKARVMNVKTTLPVARPAFTRSVSRVLAKRDTARQSVEYYWSGRRILEGHKQVRLIKVETDKAGNVLQSTILHSS
jgi:hypothetical protein